MTELIRINSMLEIYCSHSLNNINLHQLTIDMLDNTQSSVAWNELTRPEHVASMRYQITNILEIINPEFISDSQVLIELAHILDKLEIELNLIKAKE